MNKIRSILSHVINHVFHRRIFLFHHIDTDKNSPYVSTDELERFLEKKQWVSIEALLNKKGSTSICFDDGYSDIYFFVFPILKAHNIPFTIFVNSSTIDTTGFLQTTQINEMINSGLCTIGSHGINHVDLDAISHTKAIEELTKSKQHLEETFGINVCYYAYPHGKYTKEALRFLRRCRIYSYAFSVSSLNINWFSNKYKMPRININKNNIGRF